MEGRARSIAIAGLSALMALSAVVSVALPARATVKLWVNDELMQDSSTSKMIFTTAEQIAQLSTRVTLQPGDLIMTGTPAGVGMGRQRFLKPGETIRLWIEGIGELSHTVTA